MFQEDEADIVENFKGKAFHFLEEQGLPATPINYSVAYACVTKRNVDLLKEVAARSKSEDELDSDFMEDLYHRFIVKQVDYSNQIVSPIDHVVENVLNTVHEHADAEKKIMEDLSHVGEELTHTEKNADVKNLAANLIELTKKSYEEHQALSKELEKATEEITELKAKLEETQLESITDTLTGLINRRGFYQKLAGLEKNVDYSCLLLDIDHFKMFNDTYGHFIGDQVIKRVAQEIKDNVRGRDMAVRFGGEEFLVLLINTPMIGAVKVGETIREAVRELKLVQKPSNKPLPKISVSVGVSALADENEEWESLFKRGDQALYKAKEGGRNQTVVASWDKENEKYKFTKQ